ncbi:MAG: RNA-binding S4 domain-containing protein [Eubacteriales bacterium]
MRLDKYLKVSRIIKRRTVANDACDTQHVMINGRTAKASAQVKEGDVVEVSFGQKTLKFRVLNTNEATPKSDASGMYEIIE